jgi:hypothetical protein
MGDQLRKRNDADKEEKFMNTTMYEGRLKQSTLILRKSEQRRKEV